MSYFVVKWSSCRPKHLSKMVPPATFLVHSEGWVFNPSILTEWIWVRLVGCKMSSMGLQLAHFGPKCVHAFKFRTANSDCLPAALTCYISSSLAVFWSTWAFAWLLDYLSFSLMPLLQDEWLHKISFGHTVIMVYTFSDFSPFCKLSLTGRKSPTDIVSCKRSANWTLAVQHCITESESSCWSGTGNRSRARTWIWRQRMSLPVETNVRGEGGGVSLCPVTCCTRVPMRTQQLHT